MRKWLSLFMALIMLFTCAFSATAEKADALKAEEMESVIRWLSDQTSGDEARHMLVWDRETILEKLAGYDGPLNYITKEEAADVVMQVLSMYSLYTWLGQTEDLDPTLMGLYGVYTDETSETEGQDPLSGMLDGLMNVSNEEGETVNRLLGVFSEQIEQTEQIGQGDSEMASAMPDNADETTDGGAAPSFGKFWKSIEKKVTEAAEEIEVLKTEEMEKVILWLSDQTSGDEAAHMLVWDRDTILEKLEGYDEPLTYVTKEEAADVVMQVLSMYSLYAWLGKTEGMDLTLKGLYGVYTNEAQVEGAEGEEGDNLAGILDSLTSVSNEEGETVNRLLGVLSDLQSDRDDTDDEAVSLFDGTYWKSGETVMKAVFQKGRYRVVLVQGASEWSYQCEFHEYKRDGTLFCSLTSTGTGDEFRDAQQPDHGVAVFEYSPITETLTWQQADGGEVMLTQIMDPLYEE